MGLIRWQSFPVRIFIERLASIRWGSGYPRPGLSLKLVVLVVGVSVAGALISSSLLLSLQRQQLVDTTQTALTRLSIGTEASLEHAMLQNDRAMISEIVQTMALREGVERIRILDARGAVRVSSAQSEIGIHFARTDPACAFCHVAGERSSNQTTILTTKNSQPVLLNVNLIHNTAACQTCHDARSGVLGVLMIEFPLTDLNRQIAESFWRVMAATALTTGLLIGLILLALKKLVVRPVSELRRGMTEIRAGNLDYPVRAPSRDELGELADTFDMMRRQLKSTRTENEQLLAETQRREHETVMLYRLMTRITSSLDMGHVLEEIAEGGRDLLNADIGVVGLADPQQPQILLKACVGNGTDFWRHLTIPIDGPSPPGAAARTRPVAGADWPWDRTAPLVKDLFSREGIASTLTAPMWRVGRLIGLIGIMTRRPRRFSKEETQLFVRFGLQVVVAIENADLYRRVRHVATLEERDRLAREMHDDLAQTMAAVNFKTALADDLMSQDQIAQARVQLHELRGTTAQAYVNVREMIFDLRALKPSDAGFLPALRNFVEEYQAEYGVASQLFVEDEHLADFPAEVQAQVGRIIVEALTNVHKHSGARNATVRFENADPFVRITVQDDGRGFDPGKRGGERERHFGLEIMRERAASVGGKLEVHSEDGRGTRVVLEIPFSPAERGP